MILIRSSNAMLFLWIGCMVMGAVYLLGLWNGEGSAAFIVGQIVLGVIGAAREIHLQKTGRIEAR